MFYYCFTAVYTLFVPFILQMIITSQSRKLNGIHIIILILIPFIAMVLLGLLNTKEKPSRPNNLTTLYYPVLLPMVWYTICSTLFIYIFNVYYDFMAGFALGLCTLNIFGFIIMADIPGLSFWHSAQIINFLYYGILILGFAAGERLSTYKTNTKRKMFGMYGKLICRVTVIIILVYILSECIVYQIRK